MSDFGEVVEAMQALCTAFGELSQAVNKGADRDTEAAEQSTPEPFTHTDSHGDTVDVRPTQHSVLSLQTMEDPVVRLDQYAVNRLAQYLDQFRTDLPVTEVPPAVSRSYCTLCRHEPHGAVGCGAREPQLNLRCMCKGVA